MDEADSLMMPTLGRPFELGMLYDQRSDQLMPGITLWDPQDLQQDLVSRPLPKTEFQVVCEDRVEDKAAALNIDGNLKLSFLGGLIDVAGSAKYLDDRKHSSQVARVTLSYDCTTKYEQLSMKHLGRGNIKYPYVFDEQKATHVVVGLVFGAKAFFIFDKEVSNTDEQKTVHGDVEAIVKGISSFSMEGGASLHLTEEQKKHIDNLKCMFYGDFLLRHNPTTFQEAVDLYKELPTLLGNDQEKAVPVKAWLYPLNKLDSKAAQLVREISAGLVNQIEDLFEKFQKIIEISNDLKKSSIYDHFRDVETSISEFHRHLQTYIFTLKKKLFYILPKIRGGGAAEKKLSQLYIENNSGPFSYHTLTKWLNGKHKEINILEAYMEVLENTHCMTIPGELDNIIIKSDNIICFHFHLNSSNDQQLNVMKEKLHLDCAKRNSDEEKDKSSAPLDLEDKTLDKHPWFELPNTKNVMREAAHTFRKYQELNPKVKFNVSTEDDESKESGCSIEVYKEGEIVETNFKPPSEPRSPQASAGTFESITLTWTKPNYGADFIEHYQILYKTVTDSKWTCIDSKSNEEKYVVTNLQPSTLYTFKVQGACKVGCSPESKESDPIRTKHKRKTLAETMLNDPKSKLLSLEPDANPLIYRLPLELKTRNKRSEIRHFTLGTRHMGNLPEKVIMVVGATGAGKSTWLNGIANYLLNVTWSDPFRFKVVTHEDDETNNANNQAYSQTEFITAYTFYHHKEMPFEDFNLTIIDTPGYGDCRGIERDKKITCQIKEFFTEHNIVDHLDAICFITPSLVRLTPTQRYIIDSILSIYANDLLENIIFIITFADGQKPPVLDCIKAANIHYNAYFTFNNSALFAETEESNDSIVNSRFWEMGVLSMTGFFTEMTKLQPKSIKLTKEVLIERQNMETTVQGIQPQIRKIILQMNNLDKEKDHLKNIEIQIKNNQNYHYVSTDEHIVRKELKPGTYDMNCLVCNFTCHYPCTTPDDQRKRSCDAMNSNGYCTACTNGCFWEQHKAMPFRWEIETCQVQKEYGEIKKKYNIALQEKSGKMELIKRMRQAYENMKREVVSLVNKVKESLVRLSEIAPRPNPLSSTEYIDLLIESEKREANRGWEDRINHLQEVRKEAEIIAKINAGEDLL